MADPVEPRRESSISWVKISWTRPIPLRWWRTPWLVVAIPDGLLTTMLEGAESAEEVGGGALALERDPYDTAVVLAPAWLNRGRKRGLPVEPPGPAS